MTTLNNNDNTEILLPNLFLILRFYCKSMDEICRVKFATVIYDLEALTGHVFTLRHKFEMPHSSRLDLEFDDDIL